MSAKKLTYNEAFLKMGFTSIIHKQRSSRKSMKPSKLKVHFESCHSNLVGKSMEYFKRKEASLKAGRIDSTGHFARQNEAALETAVM